MNKETYTVKIMQSSELQGLTGDNGEQYVVFIHTFPNPLNSCWRWFETKAEASQFAQQIETRWLGMIG